MIFIGIDHSFMCLYLNGCVVCVPDYAHLHPSTRSWEVLRHHVTIEKEIGKGAFGQVAKGTAVGLRGMRETTAVAIKMLKCELIY